MSKSLQSILEKTMFIPPVIMLCALIAFAIFAFGTIDEAESATTRDSSVRRATVVSNYALDFYDDGDIRCYIVKLGFAQDIAISCLKVK